MLKPAVLLNFLLVQRGFVIRYLIFAGLLNLVWEVLHLPLYTLWQDRSGHEISFAVVHCTMGDVLIAFFSLVASLLMVGKNEWPKKRYLTVALTALLFGVGYTVFSEWNNTVVTRSWAYSALMPQMWGIGLSPVAQWIVIPSVTFWHLLKKVDRQSARP
ncbi:MAG: hypothetical protein Q7U13_15070 [Rhodoferax sp.]|nr:hypothetical protein [Rhodoferax sp.]